jgi:hypothetical protein
MRFVVFPLMAQYVRAKSSGADRVGVYVWRLYLRTHRFMRVRVSLSWCMLAARCVPCSR